MINFRKAFNNWERTSVTYQGSYLKFHNRGISNNTKNNNFKKFNRLKGNKESCH